MATYQIKEDQRLLENRLMTARDKIAACSKDLQVAMSLMANTVNHINFSMQVSENELLQFSHQLAYCKLKVVGLMAELKALELEKLEP